MATDFNLSEDINMTTKQENTSDLLAKITAEFGHNASYVLSLLSQFQADPNSLTGEWQNYFRAIVPSTNGYSQSSSTAIAPTSNNGTTSKTTPTAEVKPNAELIPMRGAVRKLVDNMEASLSVPTATSQRQIPIKVLEENRRLINEHLASQHMGKISFTHVIAWALVKALQKFPSLNDAFTIVDGQPHRVRRIDVNIGVAVDISKPDGSRTLLVPNIKKSNEMDFAEFFEAYNKAVSGARSGKLAVTDYQDTTITLTNPGTIGTTASNARLMAGQGLILATGSIDYPPQYQGMSDEALSQLGISKVCTLASTYDHRVIQGAESGSLLAEINRLLVGEDSFYEQIFLDLQAPYPPVKWAVDRHPAILRTPHNELVEKQARVLELITAYRLRGHLAANVNPLRKQMPYYTHPELTPEHYGLSVWDMDREFFTGGLLGKERATLRDILALLRKTYCDKVGIEFRYLPNLAQREWLRQRIEMPRQLPPTEVRRQILWKLICAEYFERFLHTKYLGQKRFSIEGGEVVVTVLDQLIEMAAAAGVEDITLGMAHRGRLNVLANVVGKFCERIFTIFEGSVHPDFVHDQGDVKYHQGAVGQRKTSSGRDINISVVPNPSHLEFVNPVVEGIVRAKQDLLNDNAISRVLPVLLHGDAAFAGEGIVAETLSLSGLKAYQNGGTFHIVINNQIGFTTSPESSRSSLYCTDIAKIIETPIFHVNSDDPDVAYWVLNLAFEFRQEFQKDVIIDLVGFRRHGHNEGDEPTYTQPLMYQQIKQHPGVCKLYSDKLIKEGLLSQEEFAALVNKRMQSYDEIQQKVKGIIKKQRASQQEIICVSSIDDKNITLETPATNISQTSVTQITNALSSVPENFHVNPKLKPLITKRVAMGNGEAPLDWGFAEALAFGSLALEGTHIRLTGQDCIRGTFSQRHFGYYDNDTNKLWMPLQHISKDQAPCEVYDSLLSEAAVLGFEYGYSVASPNSLVLWEAQFGDFVNTAQVLIDQFIAAGEEKWHQFSRLVMLLPHGFEGQGPEHSSARLERFLQLSANYNWQVCQCTNAAQYFHLLRRQIKQQLAKPLVICSPKSLLRLPAACSPLSEILNGQFHPVIDGGDPKEPVNRVVFCSGKVYYDLLAARKSESTQIVRLEQLYPFPYKAITQTIARYSQANDWVWAQEEPKNMGSWSFILERLPELLPAGRKLRYVGRLAASSPATGSQIIHQLEQQELVKDALGIA